MFYITTKDSETGKKFAELNQKIEKLYQANRDLSVKYGFQQWKVWDFGRGISCVYFQNDPDPKLWAFSEKRQAYAPNRRTKAGKALEMELDSVPKLFPSDYNSPVGKPEKWSNIGFNLTHDTLYGFITPHNWEDFTPPADCEEVTSIRYYELFNFKLEPSL